MYPNAYIEVYPLAGALCYGKRITTMEYQTMTIEEERAAQLAVIEEEIRGLTESPLYEYRTLNHFNPVIGEGRPTAEVVFIGEAPGEVEAKTGRPFVGPSGRMLDSLLADVGLKREDIYITNVVKDRPPDNRDPRVK